MENHSIEERIAALERAVEKLETTLRQLIESLVRRERTGLHPAPERRVPPPREIPSKSPPSARETAVAPSWLQGRDSAYWLSRIGIGLLLLGVAFLFKYTVDQGWLTPPIRVAMGLALGVALAVTGIRVEQKQRWFSPVMLGGASATFYITAFAAFQLFHLVGYPVAMGFMVLVTVFTFWAAMRLDEPALAVLGAIGGLATPFLLYTDAGSITGLITYTGLILGGISAIYFARGWRTLLWTAVIGGWSVLLAALIPVAFEGASSSRADQWALQAGALVALLVFWAVPVVREVLAARSPTAWPKPSLTSFAQMMRIPEDRMQDPGPQMLTLATPLIAFFFSRAIWPYADTVSGAVAGAVAAMALVAWWRLRTTNEQSSLVSMHAVVGAVLLAIALQYVLGGHTLLLTWSVEVVALHIVARQLRDKLLLTTAHLLSGLVMTWLAIRLTAETATGIAVLNARGALHLAVIGAAVMSGAVIKDRHAARIYWLVAHIALLGWLWQELSRLPGGHGYVTVSWGVYSLVLLGFGLRKRVTALRKAAVATLLVVVAKLFLIDLAQLEAIWRILLFLGFGGLFLILSYQFPGLWKDSDETRRN